VQAFSASEKTEKKKALRRTEYRVAQEAPEWCVCQACVRVRLGAVKVSWNEKGEALSLWQLRLFFLCCTVVKNKHAPKSGVVTQRGRRGLLVADGGLCWVWLWWGAGGEGLAHEVGSEGGVCRVGRLTSLTVRPVGGEAPSRSAEPNGTCLRATAGRPARCGATRAEAEARLARS
jgi:hypothetical protein